MADEQNPVQEQKSEPQTPLPEAGKGKIMPWVVSSVTVVVCAAAGFGVSRLFGTRGTAQTADAAGQTAAVETMKVEEPPVASGKEQLWYYEVDPVVANLNEPGVTRYVRVALTLEIGNGMKEEAGRAFLDQRKPLMKHWLTLYLSNQTVEGIRGERNLRLVQGQLADTLNQSLFPNARPQITRVLFKELSIQ
jgi:flagellar basal body-associated protein FliL